MLDKQYTPKVSVVIPCRNEEKYITKCLQSVLNSDYPKEHIEILVVDGNSNDRTPDIVQAFAEKHSNVKLISNSKRIVPVAMNLGIKNASGSVIIRLDAHAEYPQNYISTLVEWKGKLNATNIGCPIDTKVIHKTAKSTAIITVLSSKFGVGNGLFRTGVSEPVEVDTVPFGCFDREFVLKIGGYNERLIRNQDIELNNRIIKNGGKIILIPFTSCTYYAREKWKSIAKNNYENGKWNLRTVYITGDLTSLSIRHFIPLLFLLSILLPPLASLLYTPLLLLSGISVGMYLLLYSFITLRTHKQGTNFFYVLWTFLVLHLSYGLGSLTGLFYFKDFQK